MDETTERTAYDPVRSDLPDVLLEIEEEYEDDEIMESYMNSTLSRGWR